MITSNAKIILDDSLKKKKKVTKAEKFSARSPCSHSSLMLNISTQGVQWHCQYTGMGKGT